jgi:DNA-binding response OmpR family regulator
VAQLNHSQVKILIADDDMEILRILRTKLSSLGYQVVEANNGEEALVAALAEQPHMAILDVMMPKMNGWEVCKEIRSRSSFEDMGVMMLTAIGEQLNSLTSPLYGADHHLDKPFGLDELETSIAQVLKERCKIDLISE